MEYNDGITSHGENAFLMNFLLAITHMFVAAELFCYIAIYSFINCHDTSMLGLSIISKDTYKKRQRTNIISFAGQFYCFLAEWICITTLIIWTNAIENYTVTNLREVYFVVKLGEFGLTSLIQVLVSQDLRSLLLTSMLKKST